MWRALMDNSEQLSRLIGLIYDAALDAALWPGALEGVCGFVGGSMANIFWQDVIAKTAKRFFEWGNDPHYTQLYMEKYAAINTLFPAAYFFSVGHVFCQSEVMPFDELRETRIYKEWMQPQGYIDFTACYLEKSGGSVTPITIIRHERDGRVDDEAMSRMRLIVPHVRRAAAIGKVIDFHEAGEAALSTIVDKLAGAVFLLDGRAHIGYANAKAQLMLGEGEIVRARNGALSVVEPSADASLREAVLAATDGDTGIGARGVAVPLTTRSDARYLAHVLPLASHARRSAADGHAAAVFIRQVTIDRPSPLEVMAKFYKLTASEVHVLQAITQTSGVAELAKDLGISQATVKTHLNHLFAKTGAKRQADLVRLIAAHASPFEG